MDDFISDPSFARRLRLSISVAWATFSRKVGSGLIKINKEASMQLQFAYLLQQLLPLVIQNPEESAELLLESGVQTSAGNNNIDLMIHGKSRTGEVNIAVEMKCYRKKAASGGDRGAHDIFMKDVYEDLQVLERYTQEGISSQGIALVMNDLERFVHPKTKTGKCWAYDTSHGHEVRPGRFTTPIGGKAVNINLARSYVFDWKQFGDFWFCELEGQELAQAI